MDDDKLPTVIFNILITYAGSSTRYSNIKIILTPSFPEAALLTMGVSSAHKFLKWLRRQTYY